jgi:hypothetical protein
MPYPAPRSASPMRVTSFRYADRVKAHKDDAGHYDVLIDDVVRFRIEGEGRWPAQWRLFRVTDGVRAADAIAIDNEHWDLLERLERGEHWLPSGRVERACARVSRGTSYTRWPEYLPDR